MNPKFLRSLLVPAALAAVLAAPARAQLEVGWHDGDIGGNVDFVMKAPSGTVYVNILSLTEGPTCLPPRHPVGCLDVDLTLLYLSFQLPGFFGTMGASGEVTESFTLPNDPALDGIIVNEQMVSLVHGKLTEKSNLCKVEFGFPDSWTHSVDTMANDAYGVPAIALDDGNVLLAGGGGASFDQCELYDPCRQNFFAADSLTQGRAAHTATKLQDGRVLVCGGVDSGGSVLKSAELYDPATDSWTAVGDLGTKRAGHTANLLPNGTVLVAGGTSDSSDVLTAAINALKSTEIFDPATLAFTAGPNLARPHAAHTAVTLASGDVLLGGGGTWALVFGFPVPSFSNKAQVFQAGSGTWGGELNMKAARVAPSSVLLDDGRVLIAGGIGGSITSFAAIATSETFDPSASSFTLSGTMSLARSEMTMVVLDATHLVLVAGGATGTDLTNPAATDVVETWDPTSGTFTAVASLPEPRAAAGGLLLENHHAAVFSGAGAASPASIYRD